ncbi:MAG TPA: YciI family protein [Conexivisphaerales archaeon]|nr:YciI family protein [Conexivisphaerales archaeon]
MPEFVVISRLVVDRERTAPFRDLHMAYMAKLKSEGKLRMAGRFSDGRGGMYILVAGSLDEARALAEADPYHGSRVREYELLEWEQRF